MHPHPPALLALPLHLPSLKTIHILIVLYDITDGGCDATYYGCGYSSSLFYSSRLLSELLSGLLRGGKFGGNGGGGPLEALVGRWLLPSLFFPPPTLGIIFFFFC